MAGCWACCHDRTGSGRWVELGEGDTGVPAELTWSTPGWSPQGDPPPIRYMRHRPDGTCIALSGGLCSIYAVRPQVCRDFQAGSWQCDSARARRGHAV